MEVIKLAEPYDLTLIAKQPIVLALGFFDGVHLGHQKVILKAKEEAQKRNCALAVMTFDRYPKLAYQKLDPAKVTYLTKTPQKLALFEKLGADIAYVVEFNDNLVPMGPQEFVDKYMVALHATCVVAGRDYTYGKPEIANMTTLKQYSKGHFAIVAVADYLAAGQRVSSTRIRQAIDQGDLTTANQLLGYCYTISGRVVHGDARGRTIGFPTLNIAYALDQRLLAEGVYAVETQIANAVYYGVANIGHNETFGEGKKLTVEVYLFDFDQDVYGQEVTVKWHQYLRPTVKFASVAALIDQLKQDELAGRKYFGLD